MFNFSELQGTVKLAVDRGRDLAAWTLKVGGGARLNGRQTLQQHGGTTPVILLHGFVASRGRCWGLLGRWALSSAR